MHNKNVLKLNNIYKKNKLVQKLDNKEFKICTPNIAKKYRTTFKNILKITKNKDKALFIMYKKAIKWYESEENINVNIEKIYIKSKLGSFASGGCGIGASLFAGLTASSLFSYIDDYVRKLGIFSLTIYIVLVFCFGIIVLSNEDKKVEMYNLFLEVLNFIEEDNTHKINKIL